jgi:hypothetical protein
MAHHLMYENTHPHGNMAVLVGAKVRGQGRHRRVEHGELLPA